MNSFSRLKHFLGIVVAICVAMPAVIAFGFLEELGISGMAWAERLADRVLAWGRPTR